MAYVALYRAYRPQKFCEVVGQQHIIKTLQNAIRLNKVAHAYLFCGPRGTGKTSLAKILAKALNCENGPAVEPCNECEVCLGIQKGTVADVIEIDAASNNGADDIRALRDSIKYLPTVGKYKVYIIDEVHMLSNAAFNALLKTLEEPPKHVIFVLATTEPYKLPNTILSRCQRFDFQAIAKDDILRRLKIVADGENIAMTDAAFNQIANSAEGGMRDALSLFDQTISYSVNSPITLDDVLAVSGNVSYLKLLELATKCLDGQGPAALNICDEILKLGKEVPRVINDLILFLRDVLLVKNNATIEERVEFKDEKFLNFCENISKKLIYDWLNDLNEAGNNMRFSNQKRAYLELVLLKMCDKKLNQEANLLDKIENLERDIAYLLGMQNQKVAKPVLEKEKIEVTIPSVAEVEQIKSDNEVQIWEVEEILNSASKARKTALSQAFKKIGDEYCGVFIVQILVAGEIVAVNEDKFIVILQDLGFCNRLMKYESYVKLMEILETMGLGIKDYICLPKTIWNKIKQDYKNKYRPDNPKVKLDPIKIGVIKRIEPSQIKNKNDELLEQLSEIVDKNIVEIVEE